MILTDFHFTRFYKQVTYKSINRSAHEYPFEDFSIRVIPKTSQILHGRYLNLSQVKPFSNLAFSVAAPTS